MSQPNGGNIFLTKKIKLSPIRANITPFGEDSKRGGNKNFLEKCAKNNLLGLFILQKTEKLILK